jgi:hypothetical protein
MASFLLIGIWGIFAFIIIDSYGSSKVRHRAKQMAKSLFGFGTCTRIRVKGHFIPLKGGKIPIEGKLYVQHAANKYVFYADLTHGILFSSFQKAVSGPFQPDFFPRLLLSEGGGEQTAKYQNSHEDGEIFQWRELENETIPRWISHSFQSLGKVNLEVTFYCHDDAFFWW